MKKFRRFTNKGFAIALLAYLVLAPVTCPAETSSANIATAIERSLNHSSNGSADSISTAIRHFYSQNGYQPLWLTRAKPNYRAMVLRSILARAADEGLDPHQYVIPSERDVEPASLELSFSDKFLRYVTDLQAGRIAPRQFDPELFLFERRIDHLGVLVDLRQDRNRDIDTYLSNLAPRSREYKELREALAEYRSIAESGGWKMVPEGPTLKPGAADARVEQLRNRLEMSGAVKVKPTDRTIYDPALVEAVEDFQRRMGLESDGVVGKQTLAALNVSVQQRVQQIILNMERARWMPDDLGVEYILINVADYALRVMSRQQMVLEMRIVIGKPYRRTPVFSEKLSHLEFNPSWIVPPRIAVLDLIPKQKEDPTYFADQGFIVYSGWGRESRPVDVSQIDWRKYSIRNFPFRLQQLPGPKNALGRVKFMLPNAFSVYLHDTPAKELFGSGKRAFSSGCIRVENPLGLADFVLRDQPEWSRIRIEKVLEEGKTRVVKIHRPITVHFAYSTTWVDEAGRLHFREDIYGRDRRLAAALGFTK